MLFAAGVYAGNGASRPIRAVNQLVLRYGEKAEEDNYD